MAKPPATAAQGQARFKSSQATRCTGNTLHIRGCPRALDHGPAAVAQGSAQSPGAPVPPGRRERCPHRIQKQSVLVTSNYFAGASLQSKLSRRPPTGTLGATRSNATFRGIGGSGGLSKAHEHRSKGIQYHLLPRQTRPGTPQFCRETSKQLLRGYSSASEPESSPRSCSFFNLSAYNFPSSPSERTPFTGSYAIVSVLL